MSPREQLNYTEIRIATLVWQGRTNPEIAWVVGTSEQVIKNHLRSVFDKLGVWSRLELALYVASHGGHRWAEPMAQSEPNKLTAAASVGGAGRPGFLGH
jgi:DNA-binding CsgD family transcriptional regulator